MGKHFSLFLFLVLLSCGREPPSSSSLKEAINPVNDPLRLPGAGSSLEYTLRNLPDEGGVERLWSGWWWPMSQKGTASHRYERLSPMQKYDLVVGGTEATKWELRDSKEYASTAWAGHCNGLAAAGVMLEEPKRGIRYKGVYFGIHDVKALLVEMWQGSGWIIGAKCNRKNPTHDDYGRINEEECRDLNPGTFHLALTNYIGLFGKALIFDMDNSEAVWNYSVSSYRVINKIWLTRNEAASAMHNDGTPYTYNDDASDIVRVKMEVTYVGVGKKNYEYLLELDLKGNILGGEWFKESKKNHPDFIWRPQDSKIKNPFLDPALVMDIYLQSI